MNANSMLGVTLNRHVGFRITRFMAGQYNGVERDPCRQICGRKHLRIGDYEIEGRTGLRRQRGPFLCAADDPFRGLPDHIALIVQQKADGAGGFHGVGKVVGHRQKHNGLLACHPCGRNGDGKLCLDRQGVKQEKQCKFDQIHLKIDGGMELLHLEGDIAGMLAAVTESDLSHRSRARG